MLNMDCSSEDTDDEVNISEEYHTATEITDKKSVDENTITVEDVGCSSNNVDYSDNYNNVDRPSTSVDYHTGTDITNKKSIEENTIAVKDVNGSNNNDDDRNDYVEENRPSTSKDTSAARDFDGSNKNEDENDDYDVISLSSNDSDGILLDDDDGDISFVHNPDTKANVLSPLNVTKMQTIAEENEGLKFLFKNHLMEPLSFLLMLHDFPLELKLTDLIEDSGGIVYKRVNEIDGFTAVMVKDCSLHWSYLGPVFKVSYIQACFESKRILNISDYFKSSVKLKLQNNFSFMNVVYFKKYTWETIPEKYFSLNTMPSTYTTRLSPSTSLGSRVDRSCNADVVLSDEEDTDDRIKMPPPPPPNTSYKSKKTVNKHTRLLYSRKEDEDIVKYIINNNGYDNIKGNNFWKIFEKRDVCPTRTWQSAKEHFLKKIVYNLDGFNFLTEKQIHLLQVCALKK